MTAMLQGRTVRAAAALILSATLGRTLQAQADARFAPRSARVTDAVIARDLARFDSLGRLAPGARLATYVALAREAYERNDDGALTSQLLDVSEQKPMSRDIRARRGDLWELLDSLTARSDLSAPQRDQSIALEVALVRAGSPLLGAPSCAAWEAEAAKLAAALRSVPAPRPTPPAPAPTARVPEAAPVAPPAELRAVPSRVHFALDKSLLAVPTRMVLDAVVDSLAHYPGVTVVLEGHTDARGSVAYNDALSNRRVTAVRDYLLSKGLNASRISTKAAGKNKLDTDQTGVRDHALNRRVVLRYFTADGREIPTLLQLDDLQLEKKPGS